MFCKGFIWGNRNWQLTSCKVWISFSFFAVKYTCNIFFNGSPVVYVFWFYTLSGEIPTYFDKSYKSALYYYQSQLPTNLLVQLRNIQVGYSALFFLRVALDGTFSQENPVNARVPQGFILGPKIFLPYINDLSDGFITNVAIYTDDTTLYS